MDNPKWHTADEAIRGMRSLGLKWIKYIVYRPDLNPIELIFGLLKRFSKHKDTDECPQPPL